jgi:hypothetical protein
LTGTLSKNQQKRQNTIITVILLFLIIPSNNIQPTGYELYDLQNEISQVIHTWLTEIKRMKPSEEVHPLPRISVSIVTKLIWHYATNQQVTGSIPDGVIGIFQ